MCTLDCFELWKRFLFSAHQIKHVDTCMTQGGLHALRDLFRS